MFMNAKSRFSLGQLYICFPEILGCPIFDVRPQKITSFTELSPFEIGVVHFPGEIDIAITITFFNFDIKSDSYRILQHGYSVQEGGQYDAQLQ